MAFGPTIFLYLYATLIIMLRALLICFFSGIFIIGLHAESFSNGKNILKITKQETPLPELLISGDSPSQGPGTFHGYADSVILHDPDNPNQIWLAYSWPHILTGTNTAGTTVMMAAVSSHLALSTDGGNTFKFIKELYPAFRIKDPEGSAEEGVFSSETVSFAVLRQGQESVWFSAHLRYFLRPLTGYNPKYATSWTVRIGTAASPDKLGSPETVSEEAVLGVSQTSQKYSPHILLDRLAGLPIQKCAMLNNPALFVQNGILYLIVEALAFNRTTADHKNTTIQVFGCRPVGKPQSWIWRHIGMLTDHSLTEDLGCDTILQPEVTHASDGRLLLIVTPAVIDNSVQVQTRGLGCAVLEMDSIDPPRIKRDKNKKPVIRAVIDNPDYCACTYDPYSATGILGHRQRQGTYYTIHATGLRP